MRQEVYLKGKEMHRNKCNNITETGSGWSLATFKEFTKQN